MALPSGTAWPTTPLRFVLRINCKVGGFGNLADGLDAQVVDIGA